MSKKSFPQCEGLTVPPVKRGGAPDVVFHSLTVPPVKRGGAPAPLFHSAESYDRRELFAGRNSREKTQRKNLRLGADRVACAETYCRARGLKLGHLVDQLLAVFLDQQNGAAQGLRFELNDLKELKNKDRAALVENSARGLVENSELSDRLLASLAALRTAKEKPQTKEKTTDHGDTVIDAEALRANEILDLYAQLSGNRIRLSDRAALRTVIDLPDVAIYAGIIRAILGVAGGQVRSFAYCVKAIEQLVAEGRNLDLEFLRLRDRLLLEAQGDQLSLPLNTQKVLFGNFQTRDKA
jgi:regulator of replication initiation timing